MKGGLRGCNIGHLLFFPENPSSAWPPVLGSLGFVQLSAVYYGMMKPTRHLMQALHIITISKSGFTTVKQIKRHL